MSKPLLVSIPHRLGKDEAIRRLQSGLDKVSTNFGHLFTVQEATWASGRLAFRVSALGQMTSGTIDVADDHVAVEIVLPWLLAQLVDQLQPLIRREGALMLEKK